MTKQEQIKEITQIICRRSKDNICLIDKYPCDCNCGWARYAEVIYNEWCRKADEIRKETAKEILNDLYFNLQSSVKGNVSKSNDYYNVMGWIEEIAKEYGVEVE